MYSSRLGRPPDSVDPVDGAFDGPSGSAQSMDEDESIVPFFFEAIICVDGGECEAGEVSIQRGVAAGNCESLGSAVSSISAQTADLPSQTTCIACSTPASDSIPSSQSSVWPVLMRYKRLCACWSSATG